jgi:PAP_fibrillin
LSTCVGFRTGARRAARPPPASRVLQTHMQAGARQDDDGSTVAELDADVREMDVDELKRDLLNCVNGTNRGFAASAAMRDTALGLVSQLEDATRSAPFSPIKHGSSASREPDPLVGTWRLVFTNALDVLSLGVLPFVQVGQIYQNVQPGGDNGADYSIENVVELEPLFAPVTNAFDAIGPSMSRVVVTAKGVAASGTRVDITFVQSKIEGVTLFGKDVSGLPKFQFPINSPVGFIKTTFIDEQMRIGVAPPTSNGPQRNNVFVLLREG